MKTLFLAISELLFYAALIGAVLYSLTNVYAFIGVTLLIIVFFLAGLYG